MVTHLQRRNAAGHGRCKRKLAGGGRRALKDPADDLQKNPNTLFPYGRTNRGSLRRRIVDDVSGDPHACVADVHVRSRDELLDFVLVLSAKGTTQIAAHLSPPLNDLTTA